MDKLLETVLHRSTYSTRILGKPIVMLPGINNRVVEVELCPAEQLLYKEIQDLGIAMINGRFGNTGDEGLSANTAHKAWPTRNKSKVNASWP